MSVHYFSFTLRWPLIKHSATLIARNTTRESIPKTTHTAKSNKWKEPGEEAKIHHPHRKNLNLKFLCDHHHYFHHQLGESNKSPVEVLCVSPLVLYTRRLSTRAR